MSEEFDLSEKREELFKQFEVGLGIRGAKPEEILMLISNLEKQDKEFIRLLKEIYVEGAKREDWNYFINEFEKLAGQELSK